MPAAMIAVSAPRALLAAAALLAVAPLAHAWGDEGHEVVALVARSHLTPRRRPSTASWPPTPTASRCATAG
jgi:hypothetical protein